MQSKRICVGAAPDRLRLGRGAGWMDGVVWCGVVAAVDGVPRANRAIEALTERGKSGWLAGRPAGLLEY